MSRGQCSLNTDSKSKKSSNVKFPLPSRENASQIRFLNGFSRNSSRTAISSGDSRTVEAWPSVICLGTKSGRKARKCLWTLRMRHGTRIRNGQGSVKWKMKLIYLHLNDSYLKISFRVKYVQSCAHQIKDKLLSRNWISFRRLCCCFWCCCCGCSTNTHLIIL